MKGQKNKLGARVLTEKEMEMILPGAQSIFEQIEVFRSNADEICDAEQENEQRINNIGIMGCRGAGKTSVLRSFYQKLKAESEKNGDVVLPIIVPENMSASATLMDVVLGILKSEVEVAKKEGKQQKSGDCIYNGRDKLEKEYNEMVKKYCYIKKDYRDILMQQFTTEQYYVDKTKEVFNSDTEFITLFRKFIKTLLEKKKADSNGMVFLFIDDIDLSTTRCMDVVRTLLSYLSNPRIVTMISGDLETFEEALTLEFLRQEQALDAETMGKTYYSAPENAEDSSLLERKKKMAYEYLKKIVPPAYRKTIKYWSLGDRGSYQIAQEDEKQPSLAELLVKVTGEYVGKTYFMSAGGENFAVSYHMFDDTSRGLNNVYNVLLELAEESEGTDRTVGFWRLIETMIDSKVLYARYRTQILERVLVRTKEGVRVDFFSAQTLLYGEEDTSKAEEKASKTEEKSSKAEENTSKQDSDKMIMQAENGFAIFLLADFTARLFGQKIEEDGNYKVLKNRVIKEYLRNESIDGKIAEPRNFIDLNREIPKDVYKRMLPIQRVLAEFLLNGDFIFDIYLINYLGRTEIYTILNDIGKIENKSERWATYNVASALMKVIEVMGESEEEQKNYLASLYLRMQDTLMNLLDLLPQDAKVVYGESLVQGTITSDETNHWGNSNDFVDAGFYNVKCYLNSGERSMRITPWNNFLWAAENLSKLRYWIYFELYMREKQQRISFDVSKRAEELIYRGLTKALMKQLESVIQKENIKKISEYKYEIPEELNEKEKQEIKVICSIDERNMWTYDYVKTVVASYLENREDDWVADTIRGRLLFDAGELLKEDGAYQRFYACDKGKTNTALVIELGKKLERFLSFEKVDKKENVYLCLEQILIVEYTIEEFLKNHSRIQYGKWETRRLLMAVKELPVVLHTDKVGWNQKMKLSQEREREFCERKKLDASQQLIRYNNITEGDIKKLCDDIFNQRVDKTEESIIKQYIRQKSLTDVKEVQYYIKYMVYKEKLDNLWQTIEKTDGQTVEEWKTEKWKNMEKITSEQQLRFYLHSYLRYLQANDKDAQHAGELADSVAKLTEYVFESGKIADKQTQSEFFAMVGEELGIPEEEFETLFHS